MAMRSALAVMQEKNSTLEKNLSAETRVKLDLFSALGEARRQLEIKDCEFIKLSNKSFDLKHTFSIIKFQPASAAKTSSSKT